MTCFRFILCLLVCGFALAAEKTPEIAWEDLTVEVEFEDPFEKLNHDQLIDLSIVARVEAMLKTKPERVSAGMKQEAAESREKLLAQNIDIDALFAARKKITELRIKRATATNPKLKDKRIRLPGFALPLEIKNKKVTEFLLVPWVGACIHTPPPPPNQIVHVKSVDPITVKNIFLPVMIEGTLEMGAVEHELYLVDGSADIQMVYSMRNAVVKPYEVKKED